MTTATTYGTGMGYVKPANAILVAGEPPVIEIMKVESATLMYPGRLVMKGTNDDDAVVNTAATTAIGWLGYEQTAKPDRPATVDTLYTVDTQAAVLKGGGFVIVASVPATQTIIKGDLLAATTNGQVVKAGSEVLVVAIAEQTCTSGSYDADILVRSLI